MHIRYHASFGGQKPFSPCPICGSRTDNTGCCRNCFESFDHLRYSYRIPEPLSAETLTPQRWKDMKLIKKHGEAAGKSQHEINVEIFNYAYRVINPTKPGPSPYLDICDIPYAPECGCSIHRGSLATCPICGSGIDRESDCCSTCARLYSDARYHKDFPAPFTQRIFHLQNWEDIQLIRKRGKKLGKTEQEIEQAVTQYGVEAVREMQTTASSKTTAAQHIFPIAPPAPTPQPTPSHTPTPTPTPSPTTSPIIRRAQYAHAKLLDHFKYCECYICKKSYWTRAQARACCAEEKKRIPPGSSLGLRPSIPLSSHRFSDPCPICGGSGRQGQYLCSMCDGRGSLRF